MFYRILESPAVYRFSMLLLAPGAQTQLGWRYQEVFRDSTGTILDVGCGPNLTTPAPTKGVMVGLDQNPAYVKQYAGSVETNPDLRLLRPDRKVVGYVGSADALPFGDGVFDEARSVGLLHHLTPEQAIRALSEMCRCTRTGGKIVIFDAVLPRHPILRPLAWALRKADRGEWMRTEQELLSLVQPACSGDWSHRRFTYTYNGLEALCLMMTKPSNYDSRGEADVV